MHPNLLSTGPAGPLQVRSKCAAPVQSPSCPSGAAGTSFPHAAFCFSRKPLVVPLKMVPLPSNPAAFEMFLLGWVFTTLTVMRRVCMGMHVRVNICVGLGTCTLHSAWRLPSLLNVEVGALLQLWKLLAVACRAVASVSLPSSGTPGSCVLGPHTCTSAVLRSGGRSPSSSCRSFAVFSCLRLRIH